MHRIDTSTAQVDKFGTGKNGFTGGNPQTGQLPTALDADYFDSMQEELAAVIEAAGITLDKAKNNQLLSALKTLTPGRFLGLRIFTSSGTYAPSFGTKSIIVEVQGGGGGGGGAGATSATAVSIGGGGSAGAYAKSQLSPLASSYPFTIGSGGVGGAGNNGGGRGGDTTFGAITAGGGYGGGSSNNAPPLINNSMGIPSASGGNILNMNGAGPVIAFAINISAAISGGGGNSVLGTGGGAHGTAGAGAAAAGYGAGGGGANAYASNSTVYSGANGTAGVIIVWEYA